MMPDLILVPCRACGGDGYTLTFGRADRDGLPTEHECCCELCSGAGKIEVCEGCLEVPSVGGGLELCGCVAVPMLRAA